MLPDSYTSNLDHVLFNIPTLNDAPPRKGYPFSVFICYNTEAAESSAHRF
jgi:hypothetical protein